VAAAVVAAGAAAGAVVAAAAGAAAAGTTTMADSQGGIQCKESGRVDSSRVVWGAAQLRREHECCGRWKINGWMPKHIHRRASVTDRADGPRL